MSIPPNSRTVPAALAGIAVAAAVAVIGATAQDALTTGTPPDLQLLVFSPFLWLIAFLIFMTGFVVLGVPAWVAAHFFRRTHWYDGVLLGALVASISSFLFMLPSGMASGSIGGVDLVINGHYTAAGWISAIELAAVMAAAGAAAGLTIWWFVYRPDRT